MHSKSKTVCCLSCEVVYVAFSCIFMHILCYCILLYMCTQKSYIYYYNYNTHVLYIIRILLPTKFFTHSANTLFLFQLDYTCLLIWTSEAPKAARLTGALHNMTYIHQFQQYTSAYHICRLWSSCWGNVFDRPSVYMYRTHPSPETCCPIFRRSARIPEYIILSYISYYISRN